MEYFEILVLVLMVLAALVVLALIVASSPTSRPHQRHAAPERTTVPGSPTGPPSRSRNGDPRGHEVIAAE